MEKEIFDVIKELDFKRIHKTMVLLNWQWWMGDESRIPDVDEIRQDAISELKEASKDLDTKDSTNFITGGWHVIGKKIGDKKYYEICFMVTWSDNYD